MNKSFMKVAISLLCVMTLLFGSVLTFSVPAVASVEIPTPSGEITWADFGVTAQSTWLDSGWLYGGYGSAPEDYKFIGKTQLSNGASLYYGDGELGWGFLITQTGSGLTVKCAGGQGTLTAVSGKTDYSAVELGVTGSMADTELLMGIQMWNVADDLKSARYAVWCNDVLLGVYDIAITHPAVTLGQYIAIYDTTKTSKAISYLPIPTGLTEISWENYLFNNNTAVALERVLSFTGASYIYQGSETNDLLFNGDIIFPSANDTQIYLFASTGWHGVHFNPNGATLAIGDGWGTSVRTFAAADFGLTSFEDVRLNLKASLTNNTGDGGTAQLGIWLNDQFVTSMKLRDTTGDATINANILPMQGNGGTGGTPCIIPCRTNKALPDDLSVISWGNFANASYGATLNAGTYGLMNNGAKMNDTLFNGDIQFAGAHGQGLCFASTKEVSHGILFAPQADGKLYIYSNIGSGSLTIYPAGFGLTSFASDRFNLKLKTTNAVGTNVDFEVWINDYYAGAVTITMTGNTGNGAYGQGYYVYGADPTVYAPSTAIPGTDGSIPDGLEAFTWKDTFNTVDGTYIGDVGGYYKSNTAQADDMLLQGYVNFAGAEHLNVFGPADNWNWGGIKFSPSSNDPTIMTVGGSLSVSGLTLNIPASAVNATSFVGEKILLQVSVQYIDRDGDGLEDDLKLGIWFNGVNAFMVDTLQSSKAINGFMYVTDHVTTNSDGVLTAGLMAGQQSIGVTLESYMPVSEDLTVVTWEDIVAKNASYPITYGQAVTYQGQEYAYNTGANNTVFDGVFKFYEATNSAYVRWFGGSNVWQGVDLQVLTDNGVDILKFRPAGFKFMRGTAEVSLNFRPADFGLTSFTEMFRLQMAMTNLAADAKSADLRIWINGIYAGWATVVATGSDTLGNKFIAADEGDGVGAAVFTPYEKVITEVTVPDASATVTWNDFANGSVAIPNGSVEAPSVGAYAIYGWASNYDSLDGIRFAGQLQMGPKAEIHYGGADPSHGVQLILQDDGTLKVYNAVGTLAMADGSELKDVFTAAELGIDGAIADQHISVAFQMWNISNDKKSARYAAWVNDTLLGIYDVAFTVDGVTCGDALGLMSGAFLIGGPLEKLPEDFTVLRPYDFGVSDGIYYGDTAHVGIVFSGTANVPSVDKTLWVFDEFSTDCETWLWIAGDPAGDWNGLNFRVNANGTGSLTQGGTSFTIPAVTFTNEVAGVDILGGTYSLKFTVEQPSSTELKLGVWFNDVLYNNEYITITNVDAAHVGPNLRLYPALTGGKVVIRSTNWETPSDLNNINFGSFTGFLENTKYPQAIDANAVEGTYQGGDSLLNTSFRGNITFHYEGAGEYYMCYGGINGAGTWNGLRIQVRSDKITFPNGGETAWSNSGKLALYPADFGLTSFTDSELELGIDLTMHGDTDDMLMYFYVNGTLYNNAPMVLFNFGSNIGKSWVMYASNYATDYYQVGAFSRDLIYDLYHDLSKGDYTYYDPNGAKQTISLPGVYDIAWTDGAFTYTQTIITYEMGDGNADGNVNVLDVVKTMVVLAKGGNDASFDKSADWHENGTVTSDDVTGLRRYLLGIEPIEEDAVMPIGGYYGPLGSLVNEDIFAAIADMGITEIVSTEYNYANSVSNASTWHDMLTMAQNNGLQMYVTDGRLNGETSYAAADMNALLAAYSHFQSFAGVRVVDEPGIVVSNKLQCYPLSSDWTRTVAQYANLSMSLANVGVAGYVNLLPYWKSLAINSDGSFSDLLFGGSNPKEYTSLSDATAHQRYYNYVTTAVTSMDLPYISYDNYPFDDHEVTDCTDYFQNMAIIAAAAKQQGLTWRPHLQAGRNWNDATAEMSPTTNNTPSEGEFYWNANISLAMGAKALQYFPLVQPQHFALTEGGAMDYERNGLIGANGVLTTWGEYATTLNTYVRKIDDVLMNAEHKGVIATGGYAQSVGTANIASATANVGGTNPVLTSYNGMTATSSDSTYGAFIGCFDGTGKYAGKTIYYVVNYNVGTYQDVTLNLGSSQNYEVIYMNDEYDESGTGNQVEVMFDQGGEAALVIVG